MACGDGVLLDEVPIHGGTSEQRDEVRAALIGFDEAAGPGRVRLREVRFRSSGEYVGFYRHSTRVVLLDEEQEELGTTVRHELCHALEAQDGLLDPIPAVIAEATRGLFGSGLTADLDGDRRYTSDDERASETLAWFCEMGPHGAAAVVDGCDDGGAERLGEWLLDEVWQGFALPEPLALHPPEIAAPLDGRTLAITPTDDPGVVVLGRGPRALHVDVWTGSPVDSDLPGVPSPEDGPDGLGTVWLLSDGRIAGWAEGPSALVGTYDLFHLGAAERLLVADPDWRFVGDGCVRDGQVVFTADDRVWTAWREGDTARWTPLAARR